jgi:prepilin peptidase CpaA
MDPLTAFTHSGLIAAFAGIVCWAGITDCRSYTIPNRLPAALVLLYPAFVLTAPQGVDWMQAVLSAVLVFAIGAVFFSRGWMGGGDVKLMAAAMLWASPAFGFVFLAGTALAGGILAAGHILRRRLAAANGAEAAPAALPYGAAIAAGGLIVAALMQIG